MISIPSNVHHYSQQPQISSSLIQMILLPSNVHNCPPPPEIKFFSIQMTFSTILKDTRMQSSNSYHHSIASNMHSNITNIQINTYNIQMCTCTPPMHQCQNSKLPNTNRCPKHASMHLQHEAS